MSTNGEASSPLLAHLSREERIEVMVATAKAHMAPSRPVRLAGHLVCAAGDKEGRAPDGTLAEPPKLAVVWYDPEHQSLHLEPISWGAAKALAPESLSQIAEHNHRARLAHMMDKAEKPGK